MKLLTITALGIIMALGVPAARAQNVTKPVINLSAPAADGSVVCTITDAMPGAVIYYTTNGTTPNTLSKKYTGPFTVHASATLKAFATLNPSTLTILGFKLVVAPPPPPPTDKVTLNWIAPTAAPSSPEKVVIGYNVYRGTVGGSGFEKVNPTPVSGLTVGDNPPPGSYSYIIKSVAVDGSESIPTPMLFLNVP